jgi:antitoxin (DNA-binding transcriptional repressor) of toxin-antitoxin stability system
VKQASVRDLRNAFPQVARWIEEGECVEITRSGKPFAHLAPIHPPSEKNLEIPKFMERIAEYFPNESARPGSSITDDDRGDR